MEMLTSDILYQLTNMNNDLKNPTWTNSLHISHMLYETAL